MSILTIALFLAISFLEVTPCDSFLLDPNFINRGNSSLIISDVITSVRKNVHDHYKIEHIRQCRDRPIYHTLVSTMINRPLRSAIHVSTYIFVSNLVYLLRRSHVRNMPKRKLLQIRLTKEAGVSTPLYITNIIAWQMFVTIFFPMLEMASRLFRHVSYYYFYPNARSGFGIIFEPLSAQSLSMSERAKHQFRCDWHRFSVNVGAIGRDGYRHPPSVSKNAPHIDFPKKGLKHWPWRRKHFVAK